MKLATSDDRDDLLNKKAMTSHVHAQQRNNHKFNAAIIPKNVATPFPPLNLLNIGNR